MRKILSVSLFLFISFIACPQIMFVATFTGDQVTPPVVTPAEATGFFIFNPDSSSLSLRITYAQLQGHFTSAYFHIGALGTEGPVIVPLLFYKSTSYFNWKNIPDSIITKLLNEEVYININSSAHPDGEIRGQLKRVNGVGFTCSLFGEQEIPPVATTAQGTAFAILSNKGTEIKYSATISGLTSSYTTASFCYGLFGNSGPVIKDIAFNDSTVTGTWTSFPDSIINVLLKNKLYINVNTTSYPEGEIRGQFYRQGNIMFKISMDGSQEPIPNISPAKATGWAVMSSNFSSMYYSITYANLSAPLTAAHFHHSSTVASAFLLPINFTGNTVRFTRDGISDSALRFLIREEIYVDIHTSIYTDGEIRGKLILTDGIGFTSMLDGLQQVPPNVSSLTGTGWLVYKDPALEADSTYYQFTVADNTNVTGANFHNGAKGVSGPQLEPIIFNNNTASGSWLISNPGMIIQLMKGNVYINVQTGIFPEGEIRGQLYISGSTIIINDIKDEYISAPDGFSLSQNYPNPFNPSTKIKYSVPSEGYVNLKVYNLLGEQVAVLVSKEAKAGTYEVTWNGAKLSSGIYFYRLESGNYSLVKKMILLK